MEDSGHVQRVLAGIDGACIEAVLVQDHRKRVGDELLIVRNKYFKFGRGRNRHEYRSRWMMGCAEPMPGCLRLCRHWIAASAGAWAAGLIYAAQLAEQVLRMNGLGEDLEVVSLRVGLFEQVCGGGLAAEKENLDRRQQRPDADRRVNAVKIEHHHVGNEH